jgi:hypothetical protein
MGVHLNLQFEQLHKHGAFAGWPACSNGGFLTPAIDELLVLVLQPSWMSRHSLDSHTVVESFLPPVS